MNPKQYRAPPIEPALESVPEPLPESTITRHTYFGDPYRCRLEQYGFEYLDRHDASDDDIASAVILGYN